MDNTKLFLGILVSIFLVLGAAEAACVLDDDCIPPCGSKGLAPPFFRETVSGECCTNDTCWMTCAQYAGAPNAKDPYTNGNQGNNTTVTFTLPATEQDWEQPYKFTLRFDWQSDGNCGVWSGSNYYDGSWDEDDDSCTTPDIVPDIPGRIDGQTGYLLTGAVTDFNMTIPTQNGTGVGYDTQTNETKNNTAVVVNSSQGGNGGTSSWIVQGIYAIYTNGTNIWMFDNTGSPVQPRLLSSWASPTLHVFKTETFYIGNNTTGNYFVTFDTSNFISGTTNWNFGSGVVDRQPADNGYVLYDTGLSLPTGLKKRLIVPVGTADYAYCCPNAAALSDVNSSCSGGFVSTTKITGPSSVQYFVCDGMTNSGMGTNGETQLDINDSAEGSSAAPNTAVTFYAYYYNNSDGTPLTGNNEACTVTHDASGANVTYTMVYDAGNGRWYNTSATGYSSTGGKYWSVTCNTTATGHFNLTASDDITISSGSAVPEFSDLGWILACVLGAGGFFIASRKIRKF